MADKNCLSFEDSKVELPPGKIPDTATFKCAGYMPRDEKNDKNNNTSGKCCESNEPMIGKPCTCDADKPAAASCEKEPPPVDECEKKEAPKQCNEEPNDTCNPLISPSLPPTKCNCSKGLPPLPTVRSPCSIRPKNCCPNTSCTTTPLTMEKK